jgi:RNA polymerase sigma-70 factor (ECF subfamily)
MQGRKSAWGRALIDGADFEAIVAEHGGMLWRAAAIYEADPDLRQDLYQEILLAVWRALPHFRCEANERTYLARIAHNRGVSHVDGAVRRPRESALAVDLVADTPGPDQQAEAAHRAASLRAAVQRLPLPWQQVVSLTLEGFAPREAADVLGVSANVVSIRLSRARQALREELKEQV